MAFFVEIGGDDAVLSLLPKGFEGAFDDSGGNFVFDFLSGGVLDFGAKGLEGAFVDGGGNDADPDVFDDAAAEAVFDDEPTAVDFDLPNGVGAFEAMGGNAADEDGFEDFVSGLAEELDAKPTPDSDATTGVFPPPSS